MMPAKLETMANQAIFQLQFDTGRAIRYVQRNTGVDLATARQAIRSVITYYKNQ